MTKRETINMTAFGQLLQKHAATAPEDNVRKTPTKSAKKIRSNIGATKAPAKRHVQKSALPIVPTAFRKTLTLRFNNDLLQRARNACHAQAVTFQSAIDRALTREVERMEKANRGRPYPARDRNLKTGPRPSAK